MIIWKGDGAAALAYFGVFGGLGFWIGDKLGLWLGVLLGALLTWVIGYFTNVYDLPPEDRNQHQLWFVPIQYWGMGGTALGVLQVISHLLS
ncbi:hypothetical protein [Actinomadura kijaniata]|uniref:hypothetical protein n=1 Tax=Actinomadura kijaniata TaxID=46161 RepID=UPI0008310ECD|nr:hypothetical protein [Actinomadura kijaniata]